VCISTGIITWQGQTGRRRGLPRLPSRPFLKFRDTFSPEHYNLTIETLNSYGMKKT